jgi:Domain of unknown function (DUF4832)/Domain of unknown function (DUF4874)
MKNIFATVCLSLLMLLLASCSSQTQTLESVATRTIAYTATNLNFPNPERGFAYENDVPWPEQTPWGWCAQDTNFTDYNYTAWNTPLDANFLRDQRKLGRSVIMSRYHIADFRNRDLTPEYLAFLQQDFDTARQQGFKLVIRFAYNYPNGGPDAPLAVILRHLEQLQPVFYKNKDVIGFIEVGFVGCWGEWHRSSNGLTNPTDDVNDPLTGRISNSEAQIVDKLLMVLPKERMVAIRYTTRKFSYFGNTDITPIVPLTADTAFTGTNRSRVGHHDDCFVCTETHGGGYWNPRGDFSETPKFLSQENLYVVQGGEPGDPEQTDPLQPGDVNSPLSSCAAVTNIFRDQHWSVVGLFHVDGPLSAIKRWERDGCWNEFNLKLGYRFRLVEATIPTTGKAGTPFALSLKMTNDGYARPYNPRLVEIVLRNQTTKVDTRLSVTPSQDVRLWLPAPSQTKTLSLPVTLPANLAVGTYDVFLNLPDPEPLLYRRAAYSVRLANTGTWESVTGYNKLLTTLTVNP